MQIIWLNLILEVDPASWKPHTRQHGITVCKATIQNIYNTVPTVFSPCVIPTVTEDTYFPPSESLSSGVYLCPESSMALLLLYNCGHKTRYEVRKCS
jgi:hypothetical protein